MTVISRCLAATAALALMTGAASAATAVSQRDLNMRTGPGTGYAVVMTIPGGAPVEVLDCSGSWCRVAYAGREGYASRAYLGQRGAAYGAYEAPDDGYAYGGPSYVYADDYPYDYGYSYGPGVGFGFYGGRHYRHGYRHDGRNWDRGSPGRGGTATLPPGTAIEPGGKEAAAIQALRSGRTPPPNTLSPPAGSAPISRSAPFARSGPVGGPSPTGRAIEPGGGEAGAILRARGGR